MTKEQREYVAEHIRNLIAYDECENEESDLPAFRAALALLSDEAEDDRMLGASVRSWCYGFDPASGSFADCVDALAMECRGHKAIDPEMMLRAIAKALRAEGER